MKRITKLFLALTLLIVGVGEASASKEDTIKVKDYSEAGATLPGFNQHPNDVTVSITDGALTIVNPSTEGENYSLQMSIIEGLTIKAGYSYKVLITYKTTKAGGVTVALQDWDHSKPQYGTPITVSDDFQTMMLSFDPFEDDITGFVMWQSRAVDGTISIKKVEVIEVAPETPPAPKHWYTILEDDCSSATNFCKKYFKNYLEATSTDGAIVVKSLEPDKTYTDYYNFKTVNNVNVDCDAVLANNHDTQFLITLPVALPNGTKIRFSMRCKAEKATNAETQAHAAAPKEANAIEGQNGYGGTYLMWNLMGDVPFTTEWKTFYKEFTATAKNMQAICFNLEVLREVNNYYFDDIIVAAEITEELANTIANKKDSIFIPLTVTSAGYSTFVPAMDVTLPETIKAYTAKLSESKTSVALTSITEIPAGTPVIIEAAQNDYLLEVITSAAAASNNDLQVSDGTISGDGTIYVLAEKNNKVGFYKLAPGVVLPVGKAYLKIANADAREFIAIDGEATAIKTIENAKADGAIYNLAGQQVKKAQKGVYIINGKKVIVK